jgi:hypothetical protein
MDRMVRNCRIFCLTAACILCFSALSSATTYYIDYSSGADTSAGTSKTAPWQHLPGMTGCTAKCSSTNPQPGDSFILKGGVTWPNAVFPVMWTWSGTSGSPIYVGVDQTWYSGSSWTRPIFDAGGTVISGTYEDFLIMSGGGGSYTTWDNIEWRNYTWTGSAYATAFICAGACSGSITNVTITNNYFHGWNHGTSTSDALNILLGNTNSPWMSGSLVDSNVFDNSDGDTVSGEVLYAWSGTITHNVIVNVSNGILPMGGGGTIAYNNVGPLNQSFDPTDHENCIETLGGTNPTWYIHDNLCHDGAVGEASMLGNNGETDYVWNNLIYNWGGNAYHFAQNSSQSITRLSFWNNTVIPVSGGQCFIEVFSPTIGELDIQNNHCITTSSLTSTLSGITTENINYNVLQTPTTAASQGYSTSETYVYSPSSSSGATVKAGLNLSSSASGSLAGLLSDTSYACEEDSANYTVVCPARTSNSRPTGTAPWDVGAYEYQSGSTYTITTSITGNGTVTSSDSVIDCTTGTTGTCSDSSASGTVTLTETPASGYSFSSWGGGTCSGSSSTCAVTTTATVTATFTANSVSAPASVMFVDLRWPE